MIIFNRIEVHEKLDKNKRSAQKKTTRKTCGERGVTCEEERLEKDRIRTKRATGISNEVCELRPGFVT